MTGKDVARSLVSGGTATVALLLVVVAAGDHVQGEAAVADLVERGHGLRREGRVRDVGPVREQQLEALRVVGDVRRGLRGVGAAGGVRGEDAVPARLLVGPGEGERELLVERGPERGRVSVPSWVAPMPRNSTSWPSKVP